MNESGKTEINITVANAAQEQADGYEVGKKYAGYLTVKSPECMEFTKKRHTECKNAMVTVATSSDYTIQANENYLRLTITINKESGNFATLMRKVDAAMMEVANSKLLDL